jgi:pyruvate dehydrogenase E1 component alpha subunit
MEVVADLKEAARRVLELRLWQQLLNEDLKNQRFTVPVHLAMGHETIAVAVDESMSGGDVLLLTHRNVAYNLARARALEPVVAEYLGGAAGAGGGVLGSMNLSNPGRGVVYTSSILGNNLPVACGVALQRKQAGRDGVTWVLTGDGAIEEGAFWESLVFARSHRLPVFFVVENNNHSLASTIAERRCPIDLAALCGSLGVAYGSLRGNHVGRYARLLGRMRSMVAADGPALAEVEVKTLNNHAGATPGWATDPRTVEIGRGLVIEESAADPVWVARELLGGEDYHYASQSLLRLAGVTGVAAGMHEDPAWATTSAH